MLLTVTMLKASCNLSSKRLLGGIVLRRSSPATLVGDTDAAMLPSASHS